MTRMPQKPKKSKAMPARNMEPKVHEVRAGMGGISIYDAAGGKIPKFSRAQVESGEIDKFKAVSVPGEVSVSDVVTTDQNATRLTLTEVRKEAGLELPDKDPTPPPHGVPLAPVGAGDVERQPDETKGGKAGIFAAFSEDLQDHSVAKLQAFAKMNKIELDPKSKKKDDVVASLAAWAELTYPDIESLEALQNLLETPEGW